MSDPEDRTMGGDDTAPAPAQPERPSGSGAVSGEGPGPVVAEEADATVAPEAAVEAYDKGLAAGDDEAFVEDDLGAEDGATFAEDDEGPVENEVAGVDDEDDLDDGYDDEDEVAGVDDQDEYDEDEDDYDEDLVGAGAPGNQWGGILATLGAGLVAVVSLQVLGAFVEGMSLEAGQRISQGGEAVTDDLFHRLGYTFFNLAPTTLIVLLVGVALLALPLALGLHRTPGQATISGLALRAAIVMAVLLALGGMLAVRANLHEYAVKDIPVPRWVRLNFTNFLLGTLGTAALAVFGSVSAILRDRR